MRQREPSKARPLKNPIPERHVVPGSSQNCGPFVVKGKRPAISIKLATVTAGAKLCQSLLEGVQTAPLAHSLAADH